MSKRFTWITLTVIVAIALGWMVGNRQATTASEGPNEVRTYPVPEARAEEIRGLVRFLFPHDSSDHESAQIFGENLLVVRAPSNLQKGLEAFIEKIKAQKPAPAERVRLDFWLVAGEKAAEATADSSALKETFATIEKADGPRKFRMLEHLSSEVLNGFEAKSEGRTLKSRAFAYVINDRIDLKLDLSAKVGGAVVTQTQLQSGETIVLGEAGLPQDGRLDAEKFDRDTNIYYIVRASLVK